MPAELKSPFCDLAPETGSRPEPISSPLVGEMVDGRMIYGVRKVADDYFVMLSHGGAWLPWPLEHK
jgi:hypothetical protein